MLYDPYSGRTERWRAFADTAIAVAIGAVIGTAIGVAVAADLLADIIRGAR